MQGRASSPLVAFSTKEGDQNMNAATHKVKGSAKVPVLYMSLEMSNKTWRLHEVCQYHPGSH